MGDRGRFHPFPNLLLLARRAQNGWGQREGVPEKISLGANARDCQDRFPKRCFLLGILLSVFFSQIRDSCSEVRLPSKETSVPQLPKEGPAWPRGSGAQAPTCLSSLRQPLGAAVCSWTPPLSPPLMTGPAFPRQGAVIKSTVHSHLGPGMVYAKTGLQIDS